MQQADSMPPQSLEDIFGPPISTYTRGQAMEDGILVEIPTHLLVHFKFTLPVAITRTALTSIVKDHPAELNHTLHAILIGLVLAIEGSHPEQDRVKFTVNEQKVWALVGPGDTEAPVITIMLEGED
jgi:hypothetical protein